ncbi:hypothetical protein [Saccharothrix luteola]|uniref:hypothetical protein n=1 Tax=Saccharothrix luteola TaxID=2893018 RepID=UPI001E316661|nr:hypothetical protein [Saccharothrix luteola]MCC8250387.1 hypothetical protein [Saccharothrix luteola]
MNNESGRRWVRMVLDVERETVTVVLDDGSEVTEPSDQTYDPALGIRRSTYDRVGHTMTLDLVEGRQVTVEIGGPDPVHSLAGRTVVYLDQNQWVKLAQYLHTPHKLQAAEHAAAATVIDWVRTRRIVLPLSAAHATEIGSARPQYRATLVPLMLDLCRGWQMRDPLRVRVDELLALFGARRHRRSFTPQPGAPAVFTLDPGMLFTGYADATSSLPLDLDDLQRQLTWVTSLYSAMLDAEAVDRTAAVELAGRWARSFHDLAQELRDNATARRHSRQVVFARIATDMQDHLARAARAAGLTPEQFRTWLAEQGSEDLTALPYLGTVFEATHIRVRNAGDTWHAHDLTDLLYLACASAYADIVVCENKAADYLARAWRGRTGGAPLVTSLAALVTRLQPAM